MVANSRKKASPSPIRALNLPALLTVEEDHDRRPVSISTDHRKLGVVSVEDVWEIVDEWWRTTPIVRRYFEVTVESGPRIILFCDLISGRWYIQRD